MALVCATPVMAVPRAPTLDAPIRAMGVAAAWAMAYLHQRAAAILGGVAPTVLPAFARMLVANAVHVLRGGACAPTVGVDQGASTPASPHAASVNNPFNLHQVAPLADAAHAVCDGLAGVLFHIA